MAQLHLEVSEELEEQIQALFIKSAREVLSEVSKQEINSREFMNLKEACQFVGCSFNTLQTWINKYGLKQIQIGGKRYVKKETLVQFLTKYEK